MTVTVFSKPQCPQCTMTIKQLKAKGVNYEVIDVTQDISAAKKVQEMGYRQLPVVCNGDDHWSGFRPDRLQLI